MSSTINRKLCLDALAMAVAAKVDQIESVIRPYVQALQ